MLTEELLRDKVNEFVELQLKGYCPQKVLHPKVIHDSIHGTNLFRPYEISFLDLPVVQRLRRISQTDVASYVFPAGNHNRFEHTVGVTAVAGQMVEALFEKGNIDTDFKFTSRDRDYVYHHCRVAAIMHDCGHGPFSHLSEQVYGREFEDVRAIPKFSGASPHEILSYFIATSKPIKDFCESFIYKTYNIKLDMEFVGQIIIGYIDPSKKNFAFAVELINGAFDADKLDYILRDAHSTGVKMVLDLQRLLYTLNILKVKGENRLVVDISGVSALEEITFNKMMLTSTIYHHQKVRAAGCLLKSIFLGEQFSSAVNYLYYTDDKIHSIKTEDTFVVKYLDMLEKRVLPKRAFCVSCRTLADVKNLEKMMEAMKNPDFQKGTIRQIAEKVRMFSGREIEPEYIWIDFPTPPKFKEATECLIKSEGSKDNCITLRDVFSTDDWVRAFSQNKWQGFVFTLPEYCEDVSKASRAVFSEIFEDAFNDFSMKLCKIDP